MLHKVNNVKQQLTEVRKLQKIAGLLKEDEDANVVVGLRVCGHLDYRLILCRVTFGTRKVRKQPSNLKFVNATRSGRTSTCHQFHPSNLNTVFIATVL